jgi:hypothetical protein
MRCASWLLAPLVVVRFAWLTPVVLHLHLERAASGFIAVARLYQALTTLDKTNFSSIETRVPFTVYVWLWRLACAHRIAWTSSDPSLTLIAVCACGLPPLRSIAYALAMATGRRDARLRDGAMAARRDPIRELRILNQECSYGVAVFAEPRSGGEGSVGIPHPMYPPWANHGTSELLLEVWHKREGWCGPPMVGRPVITITPARAFCTGLEVRG